MGGSLGQHSLLLGSHSAVGASLKQTKTYPKLNMEGFYTDSVSVVPYGFRVYCSVGKTQLSVLLLSLFIDLSHVAVGRSSFDWTGALLVL